ncbi:MAG: glycosyltransferase, partial [Flavisolibacter sp.]|nr:glycosyltransferase [Flavisolibacter sp.]
MNHNLSIVVVCKNEAGVIERLLHNVKNVANDVVVYDNGSTDGTQDIIKSHAVKLVEGPWLGFGPTKRKAVDLAVHDWILFMDADETLDDELKGAIAALDLSNPFVVYN